MAKAYQLKVGLQEETHYLVWIYKELEKYKIKVVG